jgi:DNA end-binding protein Ku
VPREEIVKGYEVRPGEHVVVDKEEIAAASGDRTRIIEVEHFVQTHEVDPVFYEKSWFVGAQDAGADAYRLLHDALERTGRAAIGRFTFHNREHLAAIRPYDGVMVLHTLRLCEELVDAKDLDIPEAGKKPGVREVEMAAQLVESLHADFDPRAYRDEYREAVLAVVRRKARGEDVQPPEEPEPDEHDDLLAALQASLGKKGS